MELNSVYFKMRVFKLQHVKFELLDCIESSFKQRKELFHSLSRSVMYALCLLTISTRVESILSYLALAGNVFIGCSNRYVICNIKASLTKVKHT